MTDPILALSLDELRLRTSEKWTTYPADVLPLFVAEMDYPLAPPVAAAMIELIERGDTGYAGPVHPLAEAFADFALDRWSWTVPRDGVKLATDVSVGAVESLRLVIEPGDGVVITPPVYAPFRSFVTEAGGTPVEVPLVDGALDLAGLERAFAAGARAFLLCNPQNPLGLVHSRSTLEAVAELSARYDVTVLSDEIHAPLVHRAAEFTPYLSVSDAARERGVALCSASKAFNLAGVKCSIIVADGERMRAAVLDRLDEEVHWRTSILGLAASAAGFAHGRDWLDGVIASIVAGHALLGELLTEHLPGAILHPADASYLAWVDLRALGWGDDPSVRILDEARVALSPGPSFGEPGRGFARFNVACSPEVLTEAVRRIAALV